MSFAIGLKCCECGRSYPIEPNHVCEFCFGPLELDYDYDGIRSTVTRETIAAGPPTIWRYRDFLPIDGDSVVDIGAGYTPLLKAANLGRVLGLDNLYLKNDCVNPSYSFKDRVVSVAISKALEFGFDTLSCASTGNLACAVAAHAARAGMKACVFIPSDLEQGKVLGTAIYGPKIVAINGNYDDVNRLCSEVADEYSWAFVNINIRPYYSEGSKTLAFEVAEQLGWRAPDHVVVPIASGAQFTKIWKGYNELAEVGLIDEVPTVMNGAQALGCSPIVTAFREGQTHARPVRPDTIAKSLAIGNPADAVYVLRILRETGGSADVANDQEIVEGIKLLATTEGIFAETAGGVTVAVLKKMAEDGRIPRDALTVAYITGNGLKTQEAIIGQVELPYLIEPTLEAFEELMEERSPVAVPVV